MPGEAPLLAAEEHHPGTLPVQQMRPGDHAFLCYDGPARGWDVLTTFVWAGLARGEKVLVLPSPRLTQAQVFARLQEAPGVLLASGHRAGRLVLSSMRELIAPDREFTAERQWQRLADEAQKARREGHTALRAYIDMGWVADLGADLDAVADRECRAGHLFLDGFYSEICAYDSRRFPKETLEALCRTHPRALLPYVDALRCRYADNTLQVIGEVDLATREQFRQALAELARGTDRGGPLTLDLRRTGFLSVECAAELARFLAGVRAERSVRVRCSAGHALLLRRMGVDPADFDTGA